MAFDYEKIETTELSVLDRPIAPASEADYGIGDLLLDGIQASFPFVQSIKHPMQHHHRNVDPDFDREQWYREVYPTLDDNTRAAIDHMGGARSQGFVDTIQARQEDEQDIQERMYAYGGLPGSIGAQIVGSLVNPVDWAIAAATFGVGKYVTTANMIRKVTNTYRKSSSIALGAIEGAVGGYISEYTRQATGGIYDEDARYDTVMFGTILGGTLGATGWVNFLKNQDVNTANNILGAMDVDTKHTREYFEVPTQSKYKPVGSGTMQWRTDEYDVDDFAEIPTVPKALRPLNSLSPKGRAYSVQIPTYRKILMKLTGSDVALQNPDGSWFTQSQRTAEDVKAVDLDGLKGTLANKMAGSFNNFNAARVDQGLPKMSEAEFGEYMFAERIEANKKYRELEAEISYLKKQEGREADVKSLESQQVDIEYADPSIKEANEALDTYYGEMDFRRTQFDRQQRIEELEAKADLNEAEIAELQGLQSYVATPSKSYTTRIINKDAFKHDADTKNRILVALQNSPTAKAVAKYGTSDEIDEFMKEMKEVAENMVEKINTISDTQSLDDLMRQPIKTAGSDIGKGKFSIGRRIDVDENLMGDLLQKDMTGIIDFYHRDTGGRIAVRSAFDGLDIRTYDEFYDTYGTQLSKEYSIAGMSKREITRANQDMKRIFDTIRGTADITKNPDSTFNQFASGITALQNIRFGLGFGMTSLSELGPAMAVGGVKTLKYLKPALDDALNKVQNKEVANEFIQELQGMGIGIDLQNSKVIERYVEGRADFESSKVINSLRQVENAAFRYGGLTVATDTLKSALGGAYVSRLYNTGKKLKEKGYKLSTHEEAMFSRHGLTVEDIKAIADAPIQFQDNGIIKAFNMEDWTPELSDKTKIAINKAVKGNILEPTAMDLPWNPGDPLHKLLFQYLRFPVAATPKLLQRAIAEKDMGAAMGAMISTLVVAGNTYLMSQLANKFGEWTGLTDGEVYDDIFNDEEQQKKLATELWHKHPYLGIVPTIVDAARGLTGEPAVGSEYRQGVAGVAGPSINYLYQMGGALGDVVTEPGIMTSSQAHAIKTNIPILRLPFLKELSRDYMEENF